MNLIEIKNTHLSTKIAYDLGDVYHFLKEEGMALAGGAITSLFCNREITDYDIYLPNKKSLFNLIKDIYGERDTCLWINHISSKSIMTKDNTIKDGIPVQFILCDFFKDIDSIFKAFDFTVCMGAYDFKREVFVLHEDFLTHNSQRILKFNSDTLYPLISLLRVDKYKGKGYKISKPDMTRIALCCSKLKFDKWEDVEDQLAGMYGLNIEDVFNTEQSCSVEEVMSQLEHIELDFANYNNTPSKPLEEEGVLNHLFKEELENIAAKSNSEIKEEIVFDPQKYYKCVGEDWRSAGVSRNKIDYNIGTVVNGGEIGIYVHSNPLKPVHPSGYLTNWIELEKAVLNMDSSHHIRYESDGQNRIIGDYRVTKRFILDPRGSRQGNTMENLYNYFNLVEVENDN